MAPSDETDVVRILERLSDLDPGPLAIQNALERTRSVLKNTAASRPSVPSRDAVHCESRFARPLAVLATVVMLLVGLALWLGAGHTGNAAFAQMQKAMNGVSMVAMTCEYEPMDGRKQGNQRVMIYDGNRMRIEFIDGDSVSSVWILDLKRRTVLTLHPASKMWFMNEEFGTENPEQDSFSKVRQYRQGNAKQLADREVGGKRMLCFEVEHTLPPGNLREAWTIFADPGSNLPERIESSVKDRQGKLLISYVCKDFSFEPLDESLFSLDPPEGYRRGR